MALSKILVAYDGCQAGASALDLAADIAGTNPDVKVDVVNVVAIPMLTDEQFISFASVLELMERDAKELLGKAVDHLDEIGLENEVETFMLNGTDPCDRNFQARRPGFLRHGCHPEAAGSAESKNYLGSVGHKLLSICSKPVLVAK